MLEEILDARNSFISQFMPQWNGVNGEFEALLENYNEGWFRGGARGEISRLTGKARKFANDPKNWEEYYALIEEAAEASQGLANRYLAKIGADYAAAQQKLKRMAVVEGTRVSDAESRLKGLEKQLETAKKNESVDPAAKETIKGLKTQLKGVNEELNGLKAGKQEYDALSAQVKLLSEKSESLKNGLSEASKQFGLLRNVASFYAVLESSAKAGDTTQFTFRKKWLNDNYNFLPQDSEAFASAIAANEALLKSNVSYKESYLNMAIEDRLGDAREAENKDYATAARKGRRHGWYIAGAATLGAAALIALFVVGGKEGPVGPQGPQGQSIVGEPGKAGQTYVLTENDKKEIAGIVVKDYVITPTPAPTPAPTPTPTPAPTPAPKPTPTPAPAPAPYAPPQVFSLSYDVFKLHVDKDVKAVSEATGIGTETLVDLVDGETGRMVRKGVNTYDPELVTVKIDTAADTATFEFKSGSTTSYTVRSAKKLVDYLVEKTPLEKRAEVFQPATK